MRRPFLAAIAIFATVPQTLAQEPGLPPQWRDAAERSGITGPDLETLARDELLLTNEGFKAIFEPYVRRSDHTSFVTSDSLLAGYHSLLEESIVGLEHERARRLPALLDRLQEKLANETHGPLVPADLHAAARRRMRLVLTVAQTLLSPPSPGPDTGTEEDTASLIAPVVAALRAGEELIAPAWLGPHDDHFLGIDASRCRPRGPYAQDEALARFFQSCAWLQAVPFRVDRDEELLGVCLLGRAMLGQGEQLWDFLTEFEAIVGRRDDWDLGVAAATMGWIRIGDLPLPETLQKVRAELRELAEREPPERIPNLARRTETPRPRHFVLLSAHRTPDSLLFARTTSGEFAGRAFPSGLEVAVLLGSPTARTALGRSEPEVLKWIDARKDVDLFAGDSLHARHLQCLATLCAAPDKDAPALFHGAAWQRKTCNTLLASWARSRHAFALQAKRSEFIRSMTPGPRVLLEPDPRFYAELAGLAQRAREFFAGRGAIRDASARARHYLAHLLERVEAAPGRDDDWRPAGLELRDKDTLRRLAEGDRWAGDLPRRDACIAALRRALREDDLLPTIEILQDHDGPPLPSLWAAFELLCRRCEGLAHKQLRQLPWTEDEASFLSGYGVQLARFLFYGGNSYLVPRDDTPVCVDVHTNPQQPRPHLHAGVARARALYLLYPWQGTKLLCVGAVLPYYEFAHRTRLTDVEWRAVLDGPARPDIGGWLRPGVVTGGLGKPDLRER